MNRIKSVLAVGLVVLLAGCATTFKPWKLSDVQEGMDRDEILTILGKPDFTVEKEGSEYLYYTYQEEMRAGYSDPMNQDIERKAEELNRVLSVTKFELVLVDGKLINYKEVTN